MSTRVLAFEGGSNFYGLRTGDSHVPRLTLW